MRHKTIRSAIQILIAGLLFLPQTAPALEEAVTFDSPLQVTYETTPVQALAVSPDGRQIVCALEKEGFTNLWLFSTAPHKAVLPRQLTNTPAPETQPVFSPDGRWLAFTGYGDDVKGDIYLLDLTRLRDSPRRITGRKTVDNDPAFGPEGETLYFHQSDPVQKGDRIVFTLLTEKPFTIQPTNITGGRLPQIDSDGSRIAYVGYTDDPSGNIMLYDVNTRQSRPLTQGNWIDTSPVWSSDGQSIFFTRIAIDSNQDGIIDEQDNRAVFQLRLGRKAPPVPLPVTPFHQNSHHPAVSEGKLFFIASPDQKLDNVYQIDGQGMIVASKTDYEDQVLSADFLDSPYILFDLKILACARIAGTSRPNDAAPALFQIGKLLETIDQPLTAESSYQALVDFYGAVSPWNDLARLAMARIHAEQQMSRIPHRDERGRFLETVWEQFRSLSQGKPAVVSRQADIAFARLLGQSGTNADALLEAIQILDRLRGNSDTTTAEKATAMLIQAGIYEKLGTTDKAFSLYRFIIGQVPRQHHLVQQAIERALKLSTAKQVDQTLPEQIDSLRQLAHQNSRTLPSFAAAALNRAADLYARNDQWSQAKQVYRETLQRFEAVPFESAAARLSLAEILYREERFRQALKLYEKEIRKRSDQEAAFLTRVRESYIRKSVAAGEYLYRLGEVPAALNRFRELIDYDDNIVEAHRGYVKCIAALNRVKTALPIFRQDLRNKPDNPVTIYRTALLLTYLETRPALEEAKQLLEKAIARQGQIEYFHQTLGYVHETLETVFDEPGHLEHALESYKKAYFLNNPIRNPENRAHLALNLGNTFYALGQYNQAFSYYRIRLQSNVAFDHPDTRIIFYQRFGAAAFQTRDNPKAVQAFQKAIHLIQEQVDPYQGVRLFDKLHRFVMDRILLPVSRKKGEGGAVKTAIHNETALQRQVADLAQTVYPPPSPEWKRFHDRMQTILQQVEENRSQWMELLQDKRISKQNVAAAQNRINWILIKIQQALRQPARLILLQAELHDRLGLVYQESRSFAKAAAEFEKAFKINHKMQQTGNLAINRRSVAYNRYMQAASLSGEEKQKMLQTAATGFQAARQLLKQYGVPERKREDTGGGVLGVSLSVALDQTNATQAARGFSAAQELRLISAFLTRIHAELGQLQPAEESLSRQLADYPAGTKVPEKDQYGVSLLYHRAGILYTAQKSLQKAFGYFEQSAQLSHRLGNPVSTCLNVMNMAHILSRLNPQSADVDALMDRWERMEIAATRLLQDSGPNDPVFAARYHNTLARHLLSIRPETGEDIQATIQRQKRLLKAVQLLKQGISYIHNARTGKNSRPEQELLASLYLNMAIGMHHLGQTEQAADWFRKANQVAADNLLPDLQWRALAGLGRLSDAFYILSRLTIFRAGCQPDEISSQLNPSAMMLLESGEAEEALNRLEQIAEIERFNQGAAWFQIKKPKEIRLLQNLYPHLNRIRSLQSLLQEAPLSRHKILKNQLDDERTIVRQILGKQNRNLPDSIRLIAEPRLQEQVLLLYAVGAEAEATAEQYVRLRNTPQGPGLKKKYNHQVDQYHAIRNQWIDLRAEETPSDMLTFFGPEPVEAIDLMDTLENGNKLLRLFTVDDSIAVFTIANDTVTFQQYPTIAGLAQAISAQPDATVITAHPERIKGPRVFCLSGSYYFRAYQNRKPFKQNTLFIPEIDDPATQRPDSNAPAALIVESASNRLQSVNTLVVTQPVTTFITIPTRPFEAAGPYLGLEKGQEIQLVQLLRSAKNLSLMILKQTAADDHYAVAHLAAILGCPSVLVNSWDRQTVLEQFMPRYMGHNLPETLERMLAQKQGNIPAEPMPLLLGNPGMTGPEADRYLQTSFVRYVKRGKTAFNQKQAGTALVEFQNALTISQKYPKYRKLLPILLGYCRETAYLSGNIQQAEVYARQLVEQLAEDRPDSEKHAEALLRHGLILARLEQFETAIARLDEAVAMLENLELDEKQVQAMAQLGVLLENVSAYDRAITIYSKASEISENLEQDALLADQLLRLGRLYDFRLSRYIQATRYYRKALQIYQDLENPKKVAQVLLDLGRCNRLMGSFAKADARFKEARQHIDPKRDLELGVKITIEMANNAWFQARYQEALLLQQKAYQQAVNLASPLLQVICRNTAGLIWWTLGNHEKALQELEKAYETATMIPNRKDEVASTLNNIGLILRDTGQYNMALDRFEKALAIDEKLQSKWAIAYDLRNQGLTLFQMGKVQESIPKFERASRMAESIGNRINQAKALLGLGDALSKGKQQGRAATVYEQALKLADGLNLPEVKWRSLYGMALLHRNQNPRLSEKELREAVVVVESMRADIKVAQLKEAFTDNKLKVYETLVLLLADRGAIVEAFEIAERSRARSFIDLLGNKPLVLNRPEDQQLFERQKQLRIQIHETRQLLQQALEPQEKLVYQKREEEQEAEYQNLMIKIQAQNPQLASMVSVMPLTARELLDSLDPGTALLSYFLVNHEIFCWVLQNESGTAEPMTLLRIPADTGRLGKDILEYRRAIQNLEPYESLSRKLYNLLLKQAITKLGNIQYLGIIPHGPLHYLSFATLSNAEDFLIDRYALFYLPSTSVWKYTKARRKNAKKSSRILAIGNPDLGDPGLGLPFSEHEVNSIQWNYPDVTILTRSRATEEWLTRNLNQFGIIHIASHGEFDPINPLFSAIKLARTDTFDGNLETSEIFSLRIHADLIVLSACQTGLGKVTGGDDVIGLNRSFFYAGTHTIISSLWRVSDVSTALLVKTFYRRYRTANKATSLRQAVLHVKNRYPHPGYWGAFTLTGDYQ